MNVLTKSGSNNLRGSVFGYARPSALEGEFKQIQTENGSINTAGTQTSDAGFTVGGPVLRDRIFFFGAYNPIVGDAHDHRAGRLPAREPR